MWGDIYPQNRVTSISQLSGADLLPLWVQQNGGSCGLSLTLLLAWINSQTVVSTDGKITVYSAPSATGFTVTIPDTASSYWLVLTPVAGYAAGTIKLPALANCTDKQEILVNCTQAVTTLTIDGNSNTVTGAPTTLAANAFFRLRYNAVNTTFYRVG